MVTLTFPDGAKKEVEKGITCLKVAEGIGQRLAKDALAAKVNGKLANLNDTIHEDATFEVLTFSSKEGVEVFRHSTAHVFAYAVQELYPKAKNTIGPPVEEGFYYDFADLPITPDDFPKIEEKMREIVKQDMPFKKHELTLDEAKRKFANNKFKIEMASEFQGQNQKLTAYSIGDKFIDLCRGPHVPSTGKIAAFKLTKLAGAYWRADAKNEQLTRVYGISFPAEKQLKEYLALQAEAEKRDHRKIGKELGLIMFHEWSPGSGFFLPKGTVVYNILVNFIREEYRKRGFDEVLTPQLFNKALWEASGHWGHYKENMFLLNVDNEEFSLKPMNCPSHVLMFNNESRSYRDLPWRVADFCCLHRNELKGVLGGLTRVRKFSQDDAHIFCAPEQIESEIKGALDFVSYVYKDVFKFDYAAKLSTKPENAMGDAKLWANAESALKSALESVGMKYEIKEGDGAFYGPKIDFDVKDALGRTWQCATIQLDFQMPLRMKAEYEGADNTKHTAVMIHRAVLGSLERFFAILLEHTAGKLPLWLSPEQVRILPVSEKYNDYAEKVRKELFEHKLRVNLDNRDITLNKKIREAELEKANYILVVGEKEKAAGTVNIRTRENKVLGEDNIPSFTQQLLKEIESKA